MDPDTWTYLNNSRVQLVGYVRRFRNPALAQLTPQHAQTYLDIADQIENATTSLKDILDQDEPKEV
jgi:hypothetical protein